MFFSSLKNIIQALKQTQQIHAFFYKKPVYKKLEAGAP